MGGFAETSGYYLDALGNVNTSSLYGKTGIWLLDPNDITISTAADTASMVWNGTQFQDTVAAASNINTTTLQNRLLTNNVIVTTAPGAGGSGNLTVNNAIAWSSPNSLTLFANNNLTILAGITYSGASNNSLSLHANNSVLMGATGNVLANGAGKLDVAVNSDRDGSGAGSISMGGGITSNGGHITLSGGTTGAGSAVGTSANPNGIDTVNTVIDAGGGNITMRGIGWSNVAAGNVFGVNLNNNSQVSTTGNGNITITGTSGTGLSGMVGVKLRLNTTRVTAVNGDITITGTGTNGNSNSEGIYFSNAPTVSTSGNGNIYITGNAGSTLVGYSAGLDINGINVGTPAVISTFNGNIVLTGNGNASPTDSKGIILYDAYARSTGTGSVTINGSAGNNTGGTFSRGVEITADSYLPLVSTANGNIAVTSTAGNGNNNNVGVYINNAGIIAGGNGTLAVNGTGTGAGGGDYGISLDNNTIVASTNGNLTLDATGSNGAPGIFATNATNSIGGVTQNGDVTLIADRVNLNSAPIRTSRNVNIRPKTVATPVGIGAGAGTLQITDAMLTAINAGGTLWLGDAANTGLLSINTGYVFNQPVVFLTRSGSDIQLSGTLRGNATGNALTLASGANFHNSAGPSALSTPAGNWLVYSAKPELNTKNGLSASELFGMSYPVAIGGNSFFLYSDAAPTSSGSGSGSPAPGPTPVSPTSATPAAPVSPTTTTPSTTPTVPQTDGGSSTPPATPAKVIAIPVSGIESNAVDTLTNTVNNVIAGGGHIKIDKGNDTVLLLPGKTEFSRRDFLDFTIESGSAPPIPAQQDQDKDE